MARFAVIDLSNLFARARHVTTGDAYTKAGMAMHIAFNALRKLHRETKVSHFAFAVDHGSWRYDVYPQYKASRRAMQFNRSQADEEEHEVFRAAQADFITFLDEKTRCTVLRCRGIEADDMVARWVQLHPQDDHVIVSSDSDFVQLLAPNVSIYDGMAERLITTEFVLNAKGESLPFSLDTGSGKLKVVDRDKKGGKKAALDIALPDAPEPEWWRRALFLKIVRGDPGDGIFPAYPGITYKGTSKRTGIIDAWEDRRAKGFHWNNFFQSTWEMAIPLAETDDPDAKPRVERVTVADRYRFNELLIDLTKQPAEIIEKIDMAIAEAISHAPVTSVGIHFLRFCKQYDLPSLVQNANDHAAYLNAGYPLQRLEDPQPEPPHG